MVSIFKELEIASAREDLCLERREFLDQIRNYIMLGKWTKRKEQVDRVLVVLRDGNEKAAKNLGISENGVRLLIMRASQTIRNLLGRDLIQSVLEGSEDDFNIAKKQFDLVVKEYKPEDFFQTDVYHLLSQLDKSSCYYTPDELSNELNFLRSKTKFVLGNDFEKLDDDKLAFIRDALSSTSQQYTSVRLPIYRSILLY